MRMLREREKVLEMIKEYLWSASYSTLSSVLRAPSPWREKISLRFLKQWILQLRLNPACRMTWGWGKSGRRNKFNKLCCQKQHDKNWSCSILNTWITQKINAGGINQQPMDAVTEAIANRIKINVQSIFKKYTKRQQSMNVTFININALSVNINA